MLLLSLTRKFSLLICLSALRHRLYADLRGHSLHIFRIPGRFVRATSELTAQRSSRSVLPKMIAAFLALASVWFASPCQPMRRVISSAVFPQFRATAPKFKVSRIAADVSAASHSLFCVRRNTSSFKGSDFGEAERYNLSACHKCTAFRCFGAQPFRAQVVCSSTLGFIDSPLS